MTCQVYSVEGMTCDHCVRAVTRAFEALPGVEKAEVDLNGARAKVTWSGDPAALEAIQSELREAGYEVALQSAS